ncbi:ATP-binding cassette domain-containing protein, partial [Acinetobacter baumannii]|nr:ATP-binding cassette domain-containing protein [Acinetobacter baumannii]MCW1766619.1 ATP-binding cassette domain-containing protein [Acinetobacter baumannii]
MPALFDALNLRKRYGDTTVVDDLSFSIAPGECLGVIGPNGAGKTTTLSLFLGFVRPRSGQVRVQGVDPVTAAAQARGLIAYIPENVALYE